MFGLRLHRAVLMASVRMVVQLVLVGLVLRWVFRIEDPWVTAAIVLALTTAVRPQPWWDPRHAIPVAGIVLRRALSCASLALDGMLGGAASARTGDRGTTDRGPVIPGGHVALVGRLDPARADAGGQPDDSGEDSDSAGYHGWADPCRADPVEAVRYQILLMLLAVRRGRACGRDRGDAGGTAADRPARAAAVGPDGYALRSADAIAVHSASSEAVQTGCFATPYQYLAFSRSGSAR